MEIKITLQEPYSLNKGLRLQLQEIFTSLSDRMESVQFINNEPTTLFFSIWNDTCTHIIGGFSLKP